MLQNAYFVAKIGADTAENEQHFAEIYRDRDADAVRQRRAVSPAVAGGDRKGGPSTSREPTVSSSVKRVRVSKISEIGKFCKILQIFGGLVLGCIKTKFCKKICV